MLYGTCADTHFFARLMMSARLLLRSLGVVVVDEGGPEAPPPCSGPGPPCGLSPSASARTAPAASAARSPVAPAALAASTAPLPSTTPAAVTSTSARRAPCAAG